MKKLSNCVVNLAVLVLAGSLIPAPAAIAPQQETNPDVYGDAPSQVQNPKPAKMTRKPSPAIHQAKAVSKPRKDAPKKTAERKLAFDKRAKATLAQAH
jgi:hypothetical protein